MLADTGRFLHQKNTSWVTHNRWCFFCCCVLCIRRELSCVEDFVAFVLRNVVPLCLMVDRSPADGRRHNFEDDLIVLPSSSDSLTRCHLPFRLCNASNVDEAYASDSVCSRGHVGAMVLVCKVDCGVQGRNCHLSLRTQAWPRFSSSSEKMNGGNCTASAQSHGHNPWWPCVGFFLLSERAEGYFYWRTFFFIFFVYREAERPLEREDIETQAFSMYVICIFNGSQKWLYRKS